MAKIKLSIVVCTYNRAHLLRETLCSILSQKTSFPYEVVVSDDCSTDETPTIISELSEKNPNIIVVNRLANNIGLGGNWASGILKAQGEYIAFLDDDDFWIDDRRMQIMADYMDAHTDVDVLYTNAVEWFERSGKRKQMEFPPSDQLDVHEMWKGKQKCISMDVVMMRKSTIEKHIKLEDYIKYRFPIQDWNTNILLLGNKARYAFLDMPTCVIRITDGSMSRSKTYEEVEKKYAKEKVMYKYIADQFPNDPIIRHDDKGFDAYVNHVLLSVAYKRGDYGKAKYYSKQYGGQTLQCRFARTWVSFHLFRMAKMLIQKFRGA